LVFSFVVFGVKKGTTSFVDSYVWCQTLV